MQMFEKAPAAPTERSVKIGLVLEGGGMRGLYTGGVLDALTDEKLLADYVVGVSAGACNGVSYVSGQRGRNLRINTVRVQDKRYVGLRNFIKTGSLFGMDFIFDEIPNRLEPFDYAAFQASPMEFEAGVSDVETGLPAYFGKEDIRDHSIVLRASSSIPCFAPMVRYKGRDYLDGGASDPIPVRRALEQGCGRVVVVLTRERGFVKSPEPARRLYARKYRRYPGVVRMLDRRHTVYNQTLDYLRELEKEGRALVIAPEKPLGIGRYEKHVDKLRAAYDLGYTDTKALAARLRAFFAGGEPGGTDGQA